MVHYKKSWEIYLLVLILSYFYKVTKCVFMLKKRSYFSAVKNSVCNIYTSSSFIMCGFKTINALLLPHQTSSKLITKMIMLIVMCASELHQTFLWNSTQVFATFWINYYKKKWVSRSTLREWTYQKLCRTLQKYW